MYIALNLPSPASTASIGIRLAHSKGAICFAAGDETLGQSFNSGRGG
jgi:hypothetical protein